MFIKEQRKQYGLSLLCQVLSVSASGYQKWLRSKLSSRARENQLVLERDIISLQKEPLHLRNAENISSNQERRTKGKQEADNQIDEEKQYLGKDEQKV